MMHEGDPKGSQEMKMEDFCLDPNDPDDMAFWESTEPDPAAKDVPYAYDQEIDLPPRRP